MKIRGTDFVLYPVEALTGLYESVRGKIQLSGYELINPQVQFCGETAVLTYNFDSESTGQTHSWNCTEVYRRTAGGWQIIQTHWSQPNSANGT